MTRKALERLGQRYLLYNFPNKNSFPLYLKLGWSLLSSYRPTVVSSFSRFACEKSSYIDNDYLEWWFAPKKDHFFVCRTKQNSFLLRRAKHGMHFVIGTISMEEASLVVRLKACPVIAINWTERQTFYNKNRMPLNVVINSSEEFNVRIPLHKMDFL